MATTPTIPDHYDASGVTAYSYGWLADAVDRFLAGETTKDELRRSYSTLQAMRADWDDRHRTPVPGESRGTDETTGGKTDA